MPHVIQNNNNTLTNILLPTETYYCFKGRNSLFVAYLLKEIQRQTTTGVDTRGQES